MSDTAISGVTEPDAAVPPRSDAIDRPTRTLARSHLARLSVYWFGIQAIWAGLNGVILPKRLEALDPLTSGTMVAVITAAGVAIAIVVQPTVGMISDYTVTRWGRRKPYIVIGTLLDVVFLLGIASGQTFLAIAAFYVLLQFSSNFAQGPFQGYVPDLVPEKQVGMASGMMGLMIILGQIGGGILATVGLLLAPDAGPSGILTPEQAAQAFFLPTVGLGLVELVTMIGVVSTVEGGREAPSRNGRSWLQIGRSAWATDLLRERNVLLVLGVRLMVLAGTASINWVVFYMNRSLGLSNQETALWYNVALVLVGALSAAASYPGARLSDRFGRKPVIYASTLLAALGMAGVALAPNVPIAILSYVPFGIGLGIFLSVDWALMTDVIPKATAGRYMGILNIGTAAAGPLYLLISGVVLDQVNRALGLGAGERAAFALAIVFFAGGAAFLLKVDPRRRET